MKQKRKIPYRKKTGSGLYIKPYSGQGLYIRPYKGKGFFKLYKKNGKKSCKKRSQKRGRHT